MNVFAYRLALCKLGYKITLSKVVKQNRTCELFMNAYVIVSQQYYYIDRGQGTLSCFLKVVQLDDLV